MTPVLRFVQAHAFELLLGITVVLLFGYAWGRRRNLGLTREVSALLEAVFDPEDKTYTWIGGLSGFRADFRLTSGWELHATLVMRPWHSLLFLPFSLIFFGGDRLFIDLRGAALTSEEGHAVNASRRGLSPGFLPVPSEFPVAGESRLGEARFTLLARNEATLKWLRNHLDGLGNLRGSNPNSPALLLFTTFPEQEKIYLALDPHAESLEENLKRLVSALL